MSDVQDRRADKKARTRERIRGVAHRLFAESGFDEVTVAHVAREADVAVQTVFNHFATKEELFFDGRIPGVDGPAQAVRRRAPGTSPLTALRMHLVEAAGRFTEVQLCPEGRAFAEALDACPALAAYEARVVQASERELAVALAEAWAADPEPGAEAPAGDPEILAPLTAATWVAAARVAFIEQRRRFLQDGAPAATRAHVEQVVDQVLAGIQSQLDATGLRHSTRDRGHLRWAPQPVRRAG